MGFASALIRRRGSSNFDPTDRLSALRGWWSVSRGLVTSSGLFASLTDLSGNGHDGVSPAGQNKPTLVAASANIGNKPTLRVQRDGTGQGIYFAGVVNTLPFSVYVAMYIGANVGVNQFVLDGANVWRAYTYPGGPPDTLVQIGANQALTGINLTSSAFALTLIFNASGSLSGAAKSSEVLDYTLDLGTYTPTVGLYFGIDRGKTPTYALDGELAELVIVAGVDTQQQQHDMLSYFQGEYGFGVDFTPPGTLFRSKYAVNLNSSPTAFTTPALTPMVSPAGALRVYTRFSPSAATSGTRAQVMWAQHNSGAGPEAVMNIDGTITVTSGSVSYTSEVSLSYDTAHDVEVFAAVAGGTLPELAYRVDGAGGAWLPIPLPGAAAMTALSSPSGNLSLGGATSFNSVNGIFREAVAFTDGAQPLGYRAPTYAAGVVAVVGNIMGETIDAGPWPALALRDVTKAKPKLRVVGLLTDSYEAINTRRASAIDPLLVSGGQNVLVVAGGAQYSVSSVGDTAAAAFAALQTLCTNAHAAGWTKIIVCTSPPLGSFTDATRVSLNSLITGGGLAGYADAIADVASDATIGATGANTNTTYFRGNQSGLTLAGARKFAPYVATALQSVLA